MKTTKATDESKQQPQIVSVGVTEFPGPTPEAKAEFANFGLRTLLAGLVRDAGYAVPAQRLN